MPVSYTPLPKHITYSNYSCLFTHLYLPLGYESSEDRRLYLSCLCSWHLVECLFHTCQRMDSAQSSCRIYLHKVLHAVKFWAEAGFQVPWPHVQCSFTSHFHIHYFILILTTTLGKGPIGTSKLNEVIAREPKEAAGKNHKTVLSKKELLSWAPGGE